MNRIIRDKNIERLNQKALAIFSRITTGILEHQEYLVLGICGGGSVTGIFSLFREANDILWKRIHIFMVDERLVSIDHPDSNFDNARKIFIENLAHSKVLPAENIHPFIMDESREDFGVEKYRGKFDSLGGKFDVVILGVGEDGHIAGLFPRHHSMENDQESFIVFDDSPKAPDNRMSASKNLILRSQAALVFFMGRSKQNAFDIFCDNETEAKRCPVKISKQLPEAFIFTDLM
uniref:6-phosphogluconolactonase n=1 Tax=Candidatus Kentrum sp. FW TaxID=2126338 RepID=A0A450TYA7_9GAMM|nr:MAG: 6-phosphogluconolactonase [Candidatus Kentron sp. FW]